MTLKVVPDPSFVFYLIFTDLYFKANTEGISSVAFKDDHISCWETLTLRDSRIPKKGFLYVVLWSCVYVTQGKNIIFTGRS